MPIILSIGCKVTIKIIMSNTNKEKKPSHFRLLITDAKTHQQLFILHFKKYNMILTLVSFLIVLCALIYCIIAFTPLRTFIPGYPDGRTKITAANNAYRLDSLEKEIFKWEVYSENILRTINGESTYDIDSLLAVSRDKDADEVRLEYLHRQDSTLRAEIKKEDAFSISHGQKRDLPLEGIHFFPPLKGVIIQGYDAVVHPYIDIAAPEGSAVMSIADGSVIYNGWSEETGYIIHVQHESNIVSIYKHNERLTKKAGDKVKAGTPIALIGNSNKTTDEAHLHFELWYNGESVDPAQYINF